MGRPRVIILRTAGTNCDEETAYAWERAGAAPDRIHIRQLAEQPARLMDYGILTIPGGFSYGDDLSAGRILAMQLTAFLSEAIRSFVEADRLVLGICNGFQVLVKAGLLPGPMPIPAGVGVHPSQGRSGRPEEAGGSLVRSAMTQTATLTMNDSARFETRWVYLRSTGYAHGFLPADAVLAMPIAHAEGKLVTLTDAVRLQMAESRRIAVTYCDAQGRPGPYPVNPNGSEDDVAGLTDATGRILGLMPHPERHIDARQHPAWGAGPDGADDGQVLFRTAVQNARS